MDTRAEQVALLRLAIADEPDMKYREAMLDRPQAALARRVRQCVEIARFYKVRYIHLHMSDENAWTFPSTKYPKLGRSNFAWAGGETPKVYPLQERDLVAYADARGVTFVPEIETPGHSGQLRGTLPEIFGYKTADGKIESPGIINIAGDDALAALDDLVGEFAAVFQDPTFTSAATNRPSAASRSTRASRPAWPKWACTVPARSSPITSIAWPPSSRSMASRRSSCRTPQSARRPTKT